MEPIFFEVQLCIEMLIFKEKHVSPILIILCLVTSLPAYGLNVPTKNLSEHQSWHSRISGRRCISMDPQSVHSWKAVHETESPYSDTK